MTQADTEPARPPRLRFPISAVIMAALLTTMMLGGGVAFAWSEGWPIVGIASQIAAIPVGAVPMYRVMARIGTYHDLARVGQSQDLRALRRLVLGLVMVTPTVAMVLVWLRLFNAGCGFAGGIMLGQFLWMVRQRWAAASE